MERAVPHLQGDDLRAMRSFYVDGLGFDVRFELTEDGVTGMLGVQRGGLVLTIECPMPGHGRDACVSLEVENVDAYYEEWSSRVDVRRPPRDEEWGARTFDLFDPAGNTLFIIGRPAT